MRQTMIVGCKRDEQNKKWCNECEQKGDKSCSMWRHKYNNKPIIKGHVSIVFKPRRGGRR